MFANGQRNNSQVTKFHVKFMRGAFSAFLVRLSVSSATVEYRVKSLCLREQTRRSRYESDYAFRRGSKSFGQHQHHVIMQKKKGKEKGGKNVNRRAS